MKTKWNLKLLYSSPKDPAIEADVRAIELQATRFADTYRTDTSYLGDVSALNRALTDFESLLAIMGSAKPIMYFFYRKTLKNDDEEAQGEINKMTERLNVAFNTIHFFELSLGKLGEVERTRFLSAPELSKFHYYLTRLFAQAKHHLSEAEEKIMTLKSQPSYSMWIDAVEKILSSKIINWKGKDVPLAEAENMIQNSGTKDRRLLQEKTLAVYKEVAPVAESELIAIVTNKKINDSLRSFSKPYSATVFEYHNEEKSVETLTEVITEHFSISHEFYKVKKQLLKLPHLVYADRSAPIGKISRTFTFEESADILHQAFKTASPRFSEILNRYLENGEIDAFPKRGKDGGAFMSGGINLPGFVMLNHINSFESLMTFAHEMGHAIHTECSKAQSPIYQEYSFSTAETASTFFENFAFDFVFDRLSKKEQIVALHNKINGDVATVFRQVACFNFENELHTRVRAEGALSAKELSKLMNKHMKAYLGPTFKLTEADGYFFVRWSHLRRFFYVYAYAYGELVSRALYARYKADPSYLSSIFKFLEAGGSKSPDQIFKDIGVDTTNATFWVSGLKSISDDIQKLQELSR